MTFMKIIPVMVIDFTEQKLTGDYTITNGIRTQTATGIITAKTFPGCPISQS